MLVCLYPVDGCYEKYPRITQNISIVFRSQLRDYTVPQLTNRSIETNFRYCFEGTATVGYVPVETYEQKTIITLRCVKSNER